MRALHRLFARVRNLLFRRQGDARLREELEQHLAFLSEENVRAGMSPAEARRQAALKLGAVQSVRESYHAEEGVPLIEHLFADLRFSLRVLLKSPSFAIVAILSLAFAIGANAIVFSVLNALILRPLNIPHPQSLYSLEREPQNEPFQSYPDYRELRDHSRTFESLVAYAIIGSIAIDTGNNASIAWPCLASGNYFDALGIQPYLGHFFHAADEKGTNSAPYLVLSYDYWRAHFHADPAVLGTTVQLNKHPFTIIGVAPAGFRGTELFLSPDFWAPIVDLPEVGGWNPLENYDDRPLWIAGHLKPGITRAQATGDLNAIAASLAQAHPRSDEKLHFAVAHPGLLGDHLGRPARAFMAGLMLLAGLI
ncbi:MAG: ABC transporter permease, partial [Acidobacteriaceae bacterium]